MVLSLTFFFVALQGSVAEIRTNEEHFSLKNEKKLKTASLKQSLLVLIKKRVYLQRKLPIEETTYRESENLKITYRENMNKVVIIYGR